MSSSQSEICTHIVTINSEKAATLLRATKRNRPLNQAIVRRYQNDMVKGLWKFAGDPIRIDSDGYLIDGQHRLSAVASCDPPIEVQFLVINGLPAESQLVMDQGQKRSSAQQLALLGHKNTTQIASGTRLFLLWEKGLLFRSSLLHPGITNPVIQQWVEHNPDLVDFATTHRTLMSSTDAPLSVATAFAFKVAERDPYTTEQFFQLLHDRINLPEGSPILTLDNKFRRLRRESIKSSSRDLLACYILCWNAWISGRSMVKFQRPRGGSWTADNYPIPLASA